MEVRNQPNEALPGPWTIALAGLAALAVAMGVGRFAFTPILPLMERELGVDIRTGAWLATANYVGYLVGSVAAIWVRVPAMPTVAASLATVAISTAGMAWTAHVDYWIALRLLAGISSAFVLVLVSKWAFEQLARCNGLKLRGAVFSGVGVGIAVSGVLCWLIGDVWPHSSNVAWITLGALSLVAGAVVYAVMARAPAEAAAVHLESIRMDTEFLRLVLCYGAFGFAYIVPATFLPVMASSALGATGAVGLAWPMFGAAAAISTLLSASAFSAVSPRRLWRAGNAVMAVGLLAAVFVPGFLGIATAAVCVGGTFMVITMAGMQEARRVGGRNTQTYMAAMTAAFAANQVLGPVVIATLREAEFAFQVSMISAAVLLALAAWVLGNE